jgi:hypothetical protein
MERWEECSGAVFGMKPTTLHVSGRFRVARARDGCVLEVTESGGDMVTVLAAKTAICAARA